MARRKIWRVQHLDSLTPFAAGSWRAEMELLTARDKGAELRPTLARIWPKGGIGISCVTHAVVPQKRFRFRRSALGTVVDEHTALRRAKPTAAAACRPRAMGPMCWS